MVNRKEGNNRERSGHKLNFPVKAVPDLLPKTCQVIGGICVDTLGVGEVRKVGAVMAVRYLYFVVRGRFWSVWNE